MQSATVEPQKSDTAAVAQAHQNLEGLNRRLLDALTIAVAGLEAANNRCTQRRVSESLSRSRETLQAARQELGIPEPARKLRATAAEMNERFRQAFKPVR